MESWKDPAAAKRKAQLLALQELSRHGDPPPVQDDEADFDEHRARKDFGAEMLQQARRPVPAWESGDPGPPPFELEVGPAEIERPFEVIVGEAEMEPAPRRRRR